MDLPVAGELPSIQPLIHSELTFRLVTSARNFDVFLLIYTVASGYISVPVPHFRTLLHHVSSADGASLRRRRRSLFQLRLLSNLFLPGGG